MFLVIDGNAFLNVAISVTKSVAFKDKTIGEKYYVEDLFSDQKAILKEHVRISFRNFCFNYLNSIIAPVGNILSGVHIVFDSKSWRKEYVNSFFKNSDFKTKSAAVEFSYKGNRKHDEFQYLFFNYFQKALLPILRARTGINSYRFKETEGEDIIAYLCEILDGDILIYSVDQDIKQLLANSKKNVLLMTPKQMSKSKKLYVPITLVPAVTKETDDFFSLSDEDISGSSLEKVINSLKSKDYVEHRINPFKELIEKILGGDKSDKIPRLDGMTPKKLSYLVSTISEKFGSSAISKLDELDPEFINFVVSEVCKVNKVQNEGHADELKKHLLFNIKIIRLSVKVFPDEIRNALVEFFSNTNNWNSSFNYREFTNLKNNQSFL